MAHLPELADLRRRLDDLVAQTEETTKHSTAETRKRLAIQARQFSRALDRFVTEGKVVAADVARASKPYVDRGVATAQAKTEELRERAVRDFVPAAADVLVKALDVLSEKSAEAGAKVRKAEEQFVPSKKKSRVGRNITIGIGIGLLTFVGAALVLAVTTTGGDGDWIPIDDFDEEL